MTKMSLLHYYIVLHGITANLQAVHIMDRNKLLPCFGPKMKTKVNFNTTHPYPHTKLVDQSQK